LELCVEVWSYVSGVWSYDLGVWVYESVVLSCVGSMELLVRGALHSKIYLKVKSLTEVCLPSW
jgi:hypothetical protein